MSGPIIIAGAGPVGLTLALLLHEQGHDVAVYESVSRLEPLGVGINLLPHSVRVLAGLGLIPQLDKIGIRTSELRYYNKYGQQIWAEPRGLDAGYPFPQFSVHRGQLQLMLFEEVKTRLGEARLNLGHKMTSWQDSEDGVTVQFETSSGPLNVQGRCLLAADGINSVARRTLYPDEGAPIYGGRILWRATTTTQSFLNGSTMFMAGHQDCKFVAYPIANFHDGTAMINWIAELSVPNHEQEYQDWNQAVSIDRFKAAFETWQFDWIDIPALIQGCNQVFEYPLSDRDPLPAWSHGNMTLVGDAAHPMYPIGSNGASQGILDAEKLTNEITQGGTLQVALNNYESERRPATSAIVLSNRQNGPEQVMQMAEERAPNGFSSIDEVIPRRELEEIAARYKQTAGFSVSAVKKSAES